MNDCSLLRDDLKAYLDGELPCLRRWAVRRHLSRCESCRREAQAIEQISRRLRAVPTEEFPAALRARILANLPDAPPAPAPSRLAASRWRPQPMVTWGAAAALLLTALLIYPYFSPSPQMRQAAQSPLDRMAGGALSDDSLPPSERQEMEGFTSESRSPESAAAAPDPSGAGMNNRTRSPAPAAPPDPSSGSRALPQADLQAHKRAQTPANAQPSAAKPGVSQQGNSRRDSPQAQRFHAAGGNQRKASMTFADTPLPKEREAPDIGTHSDGTTPAPPAAALDAGGGKPAPSRAVRQPGMAGMGGGGLGAPPGATGDRANPEESRALRAEAKNESLEIRDYLLSLPKERQPEVVLEVESVPEKSLELKRIVLKLGGSITESNALRHAAPSNSAAYSLQIPPEKFQEMLEQIAALGTLQIPQTEPKRSAPAESEPERLRQRQGDSEQKRLPRTDAQSQSTPPENILRRLIREMSRKADADSRERRPDSPVPLLLQIRQKSRP